MTGQPIPAAPGRWNGEVLMALRPLAAPGYALASAAPCRVGDEEAELFQRFALVRRAAHGSV